MEKLQQRFNLLATSTLECLIFHCYFDLCFSFGCEKKCKYKKFAEELRNYLLLHEKTLDGKMIFLLFFA